MSKVNLDISWKKLYRNLNYTDESQAYALMGASDFQKRVIQELSQINKSDSMADKLARLKIIEIVKNLKA